MTPEVSLDALHEFLGTFMDVKDIMSWNPGLLLNA